MLVDAKGLTRFGGLSLVHQLCHSLGLRRFRQTYVHWPRYLHRSSHPVDRFLAHRFAIVAGLGRIENTKALLHHGLIPPILGLPDFPHRDTLRTFWWRFDPQALRRLEAVHDRFRTALCHRLGLRYDAIVEAGTTTRITYGHPERVARGSIPKRRHPQGSYAPLLASEGHSGLSLGAQLRAGDVQAVTGSWPFLAVQLDTRPPPVAASRTRVRLDGAFYAQAIIQPLDGKRVGDCIVARMTQPLKDRMVAARYHEFRAGWEAAAFPDTPFHWNQAHRFVAVRRPITHEPLERQPHLFTFKRYTDHRALVTNVALTAEAVYRVDCDRASQELLLREFQHASPLAAIPTKSFWANATSRELLRWASDLVVAFQHRCLPPEHRHWNIATLRRELWWLPAEWIKRGTRHALRIPAKDPHPEWLHRMQRAASRVTPLL